MTSLIKRRVVVAAIAVATGLGGIGIGVVTGDGPGAPGSDPSDQLTASQLHYQRLDNPDRTIVRTGRGDVVVTLTDGARSAAVAGPARTISDPAFTTATVTSSTWVRLLPTAWTRDGESDPWFRPWLESVLNDRSPDIIEVASQYLQGQPDLLDPDGTRFRGDAGFGPADSTADATRTENSDFYDYLGRPWTFSTGSRGKPDPTHLGDVDCSGYLRLVFGYRLGYPLLDTNTAGPGLPRRAYAIADRGPGTVIVPDHGAAVTDYSELQPGDLVFFNIDTDPQIDHAGIYLGLDETGHHRFISSRGKANGPTLGDLGGTSLLDDEGHYSRAFRMVKRI